MGPGDRAGLEGEDRRAVGAAVPVGAGTGQQGADGLSAALGQRGAGEAELGVVQGRVGGPANALVITAGRGRG